MKKDTMDHLIRDSLHRKVGAQEPSPAVRAGLLAQAAAHNSHSEPVVGASIPPIANGLRELRPASGLVCRPEFEVDLMEFFGTTQQRLVSVWLLALNTRY